MVWEPQFEDVECSMLVTCYSKKIKYHHSISSSYYEVCDGYEQLKIDEACVAD